MHDLRETYTFLCDNCTSFLTTEIDLLHDGNIFLNVDDPETEVWQWDTWSELVFETHDTEGSFRCVRNFLKNYEALLRIAGVLEVYHPPYVSDNTANSESEKLQAIREGFDTLRTDNSLIDVMFIPANDEHEETQDPPLVAHRVFLAVISEHFSSMFRGDFAESRLASTQDPLKLEVPYSRPCIRLILGISNYVHRRAFLTFQRRLHLHWAPLIGG